MKIYALCAVSSTLVFIAGLAWQSGSFNEDLPEGEEEVAAEVTEPAPAPSGVSPVAANPAPAAKSPSTPAVKPGTPAKRLRFPQDLAPAAQARKVEKAATFKPSVEPHKVAVMKPDGSLHDWHESFPEDWRAYRVEEAELVVVVGPQKKIFIDETSFSNGPPIRRYTFEVTVSVVVPKTGRVVGYKTFRHVPRAIRNWELFATTMIGRAVPWSFVFQWVETMAHIGFPEEVDTTPLVREAEL